MIPCPACRAPARSGPCPFCGTLVAVATVLSMGTAMASPITALYGVPDTGEMRVVPEKTEPVETAIPLESRARSGDLTEKEVTQLKARAATELEAAQLLEQYALVKGADDVLATALKAQSALQPTDPGPLYRLTMLSATGTDCAATLAHARSAEAQLSLWKPGERLDRSIRLSKIAATCQQVLTPNAPEAIRAAKAFVALSIEGNARVPKDLKELSQLPLP